LKSTLVTNVTILAGDEFREVDHGNLLIRDNEISYIGQGHPDAPLDGVTVDGQGLLAIPGLIDAHIHIGDSVAKDIGTGKTLNELVHPLYGIKTQILSNESPELIRTAIRQTASDMLGSGITTFADFREGGLQGIKLAQQALRNCKQRVMLLCRPKFTYSETEIARNIALPESVIKETRDALRVSSGLGLSGANEYSQVALEQLNNLAKQNGKPIAIHAAESLDSVRFSNEKFHASEIQRILQCMTPNMIVHVTQASSDDISGLAKLGIGVICCPRANASLGVGFPPIQSLLERNVRVALGTDNVMLNAPDMFREMDYTARMIKAKSLNPSAISSTEILKMATANAAHSLGLGSSLGTLAVGKKADIIFLDLSAPNLRFSRDLVASVVHRARPDNIMCVMINGEIVHGSL